MREPQTLGTAGLTRRLTGILAARGINPTACDHLASVTPTDGPVAALEAAEAAIPPRYRQAVADHPQVTTWVQAVASAAVAPGKGARRQVATGPSLLLIGATGTGKTHQAYGAIHCLLAARIGVRWQATSAADLYAQLRPRPGHDSEQTMMAMARCRLLILDDLGAAKSSEWTEELTYRLINRRYNHMLPTLITTNLPIGALRDAVGDRVASRLAEMTERVILTGADRRRRTSA